MNSSESSVENYDWVSAYQNLKNINIEHLSSKLTLLFKTLPSYSDFMKLYESTQINNNDIWSGAEELLLQLTVLSHNPDCIKNRFNWEKVQKMMPRWRSIQDLHFKFQSYYKAQLPRQPWSIFEDNLLLNVIKGTSSKCKKKWGQIADSYNSMCQSEIIRTAKQCRERWNNKLDPFINRGPWSRSEELSFLQLLLQNGRKWAEISLKLSSITNFKRRTEFALKHKFKQLRRYSKHLSPIAVPVDKVIWSKWNPQELQAILSKILSFHNKPKTFQTRKFFLSEFSCSIDDSSLVIIKNGNLHIL